MVRYNIILTKDSQVRSNDDELRLSIDVTLNNLVDTFSKATKKVDSDNMINLSGYLKCDTSYSMLRYGSML